MFNGEYLCSSIFKFAANNINCIKFFVLNNDGYASIRTSQENYFHQLVAADSTSGLTLPDVLKVAQAYGLATARIEKSGDLREEIGTVLKMEGPVVCEVVVPAEE